MPDEIKVGDWRTFWDSLDPGTDPYQSKPSEDIGFIGKTNIKPAPEAKYDIGLTPFTEDIEAVRRSNQSAADVVENAFQNAGATALMEIGEGLGYIGTGLYEIVDELWDKDDNDFIELQNSFSTWFREGKEEMMASNPIYAKEEDQNFNPFNGMSWAVNAGSIGSTVSLLIPAYGIGKGALWGALKAGNAISKLSKVGKASAKIGKGLQSAEQIAASLKAAKQIQTGGEIAATAAATLASRHAENYLEAFGTYNQSLIGSLQEEYNMSYDVAESQAHYLLANPEEAMASKYKDVFMKGADAATRTARWNWLAGSLDAAQYAMAFTGLGGILKFRKVASSANKLGRLARYANATKKGINATSGLAFQMGSEAIEEGYQAIVSKEALRGGEMFGEGFAERFDDYLNDEEVRSSMLMGAVMGGGFHVGGSAISKAVGSYKNKVIQYETAANLRDIKAGAGIINAGLAQSIKNDININGGMRNVIKSLEKVKSQMGDNASDEFLQTADAITTLAGFTDQLASEVDAKGKPKYTTQQLSNLVTHQFIASSFEIQKETVNKELESLYSEMDKGKILRSEDSNAHKNKMQYLAIKEFLKTKKGNPSKAEKEFLTNLEKKLEELEVLDKKASSTTNDSAVAQLYFDGLHFEMMRNHYSDLVGDLQTKEGAIDAEVKRQQNIQKTTERIINETKEDNQKAVEKAETVTDISALLLSEIEGFGNADNAMGAIKEQASITLPKINTILQGRDIDNPSAGVLFPEEKIAKIAKLLTDNPAAHFELRSKLKELLDLEISSDPKEAAEQIIDKVNSEITNNPNTDIINVLNDGLGLPTEDVESENTGDSDAPVGGDKGQYDTNSEISKIEKSNSGPTFTIPILPHLRVSNGQIIFDANNDPQLSPYTKGSIVLNTELHLDPKFNPRRQVFYVINTNFESGGFVQELEDGKLSTERDNFIEMYTSHKGDRIYIGTLPKNQYTNSLRAEIIEEFNNRTDGSIKFTSKIQGKIIEKLPGRVTNLANGVQYKTLKELIDNRKSKVYLATTQVSNKGTSVYGLPSDLPVLSNDYSNLARNSKGEEVGGYVFAFIESANGKYIPVRLFTPKIGEETKLVDEVTELVKTIYNFDYPNNQEEALKKLIDLVHINRERSNISIRIKEGKVYLTTKIGGVPSTTTVEENVLIENLKNQLLYVIKEKLNDDNYIESIQNYLTHNVNTDAPIDSPSYKVQLDTRNEIEVNETAAPPNQQVVDKETGALVSSGGFLASIANSNTEINSQTKVADINDIFVKVSELWEQREKMSNSDKRKNRVSIDSELAKNKEAELIFANIRSIYKALGVKKSKGCP